MYPVKELFLEDVLEITGHTLTGVESSCPGAREWHRKELQRDPLFEVFEASAVLVLYSCSFASQFSRTA
jgi:hypothetical protein